MTQEMMQVRLRAGYGKQQVLRDVQFTLQAGEALGLIGTSGAGKTTLVMALLGLLEWRGGHAEGEVIVGGQNLLALSGREARRIRGKQITKHDVGAAAEKRIAKHEHIAATRPARQTPARSWRRRCSWSK